MSSNTNSLDANELMHLALHATNHDTPEKAISHLKSLLALEPNNGKAYYMLGALHAEIGMHEQAAEEMQHALELDPDLPETAVFQLGLLHITAGRVEDARNTWQRLDSAGESNPLYQFKTAMLHLVQDNFQAASAAFRKGIKLNNFSPDLNNDMQRILDDVERAGGISAPEITGGADAVNQASQGQRMLLSIYEREGHNDS